MQPLSDSTNSPIARRAGKPTTKTSVFGKVFGRRNSKPTVEATIQKHEQPTEPPAAAPVFYSVVHTFKEGKADSFWTMISSLSDKDWAAMAEKHHSMGFHNHSFIPTSPTGVVNCLWECSSDKTPEEFAAFINGEDGPAPGIFDNECHRVMPGAAMPSSFFHAPAPTPTMPTTGCFFWVYHTFKEGAADGFWAMLGGMTEGDFAAMADKHHALGFHNHSFAPTDKGICICIWEAKEPTSVAAFQAFIDGPDGPGAGTVFTNDVFQAMAGAVLPPAHWPQPSVVQHRVNRIPIKEASMESIKSIASGDEMKGLLQTFDGLVSVDLLSLDATTMVTHSRWKSEAYGGAAAAALGKVLGGALKEFVTGPPTPTVGTVAWSLSGSASPISGVEPRVRLTTFELCGDDAFEEMLSAVKAREAEFKALDGLIGCDAIRASPTSALVAARYSSLEAMEAAAPTVQKMMKELGELFAAPPAATAASVVWSFAAPPPPPFEMHICQPADGAQPDKCLGPEGQQAKMWVTKLPDGRQTMRLKIDKGFDWLSTVSPMLPGCPAWCPATHFGYLESGSMGVKMSDGTERTIKAGETYLIPPGHLPVMSEAAVMVEFSQDTTYTKDLKK